MLKIGEAFENTLYNLNTRLDSMINIVKRFFIQFEDTTADRDIEYGFQYEKQVQAFFIQHYLNVYFNRMVPNTDDSTLHPLEFDVIVYENGQIFCFEIKSHKGKISISKDGTRLVQQKKDKFGRKHYKRNEPNPMRKKTGHIKHLKDYLKTVDDRFESLDPFYIHLAVIFPDDTDISALRSIDPSFINLKQVRNYIKSRSRNVRGYSWVTRALNSLPTWDVVTTVKNDVFYGTVDKNNKPLEIRDLYTQQRRIIPYNQIKSIEVTRNRRFFSEHDLIKIITTDDEICYAHNYTDSYVTILYDGNKRKDVNFRNIQKVEIGISSR